MTFQKVAQLISEHKDIKIEKIKEDTTFESLGFDSLDVVELIMVFEQEFGVSITLNEGLKTVGDVVKLLDENK